MTGKSKPAPDDRRMPYKDVPAFLRALRKEEGPDAAKDALEWLILTATRTNETLGARFSEMNAKAATWTISPKRTKSVDERVVPLSDRALEIFAACKKRHSGRGDLIFESAPGKPLSSAAMLMLMRRMNLRAIPHGFRYSFRYWAADRAKNVGAARVTDSLDERRKLLDDWSLFCADAGKALRRGAKGL